MDLLDNFLIEGDVRGSSSSSMTLEDAGVMTRCRLLLLLVEDVSVCATLRVVPSPTALESGPPGEPCMFSFLLLTFPMAVASRTTVLVPSPSRAGCGVAVDQSRQLKSY